MLPLNLITAAKGHPIQVELKNGETYNGVLGNVDVWMNLNLRDVILTRPCGTRFFRLTEIWIRGNHIRYFRIPDPVLDLAKDEPIQRPHYNNHHHHHHGGGSGDHHHGHGGHRGGHRD
ncbi:hypothetical protein CXG81DRAFT_2850, partial [Caulochytrium protostelioides]